MTSPAGYIFVSYKSEDRSLVAPLVHALQDEGFTVWWDAHIEGGANWQREIEENLEAAKCVIVVWTRRSVHHDGHFVRDEARWAQRRGTYLPICLDPVDPPLGFGEIQALSLVGWRGNQNEGRFATLVEAVKRRIDDDHMPAPAKLVPQPQFRRRALILGGAGAISLAAGAGGWFLLRHGTTSSRRIAVLPFNNLSGDAREAYFCDGLAEELRGALSRIGLEVIGRMSSEAVAKDDIATIAAKLDVSHVLTGSVRRSPQMIRVSTQLVDSRSSVETWSQNYDRTPGEVIAIQADIAANVAETLKVALLLGVRKAIELGGTDDPVAQDYLLQAEQLYATKGYERDAMQDAKALLRLAIERDPQYARAWSSLSIRTWDIAALYSTTQIEHEAALAEAEVYARKALAIAPGLGFAHAALAELDMDRLKFRSTLAGVQKALSLSPNDSGLMDLVGIALPWIGSLVDAKQLADRLVLLEPLSPSAYARLSVVHYTAGRFTDAVAAADRAVQLGPQHLFALYTLLYATLSAGQLDRSDRIAARLPPDDPSRLTCEAISAADRGAREVAMQRMATMRSKMGDMYSFNYAEINAQLGNIEAAFASLERAIEVRDAGLMYTLRDPFLAPMRKDSRFVAILKRLDFPSPI